MEAFQQIPLVLWLWKWVKYCVKPNDIPELEIKELAVEIEKDLEVQHSKQKSEIWGSERMSY